MVKFNLYFSFLYIKMKNTSDKKQASLSTLFT